ncbi:hypothetical protein IWW38_003213, partial [Coemansia aciculifera]
MSPNTPITPESSTINFGMLGSSSSDDTAAGVVEFGGDPSYQRFLNSAAAAAAADLGITDSVDEGFSMPSNGGSDLAISASLSSPPSLLGVYPVSTLFSDAESEPIRMVRRSTQPDLPHHYRRRGSLSLSRSHPYIPAPTSSFTNPTPRRSGNNNSNKNSSNQSSVISSQKQAASKSHIKIVIPAINHDGSYKQCSNCRTVGTPSWRRHPETQALLCNACGLYL